MSHVEAIYRRGVFEPLAPVQLPEDQRVRLDFEPAPAPSSQTWLDALRRLHSPVLARRGPLPDSAADIAEDRRR